MVAVVFVNDLMLDLRPKHLNQRFDLKLKANRTSLINKQAVDPVNIRAVLLLLRLLRRKQQADILKSRLHAVFPKRRAENAAKHLKKHRLVPNEPALHARAHQVG